MEKIGVKEICWTCNATLNTGNKELVVLEGEGHFTVICKKCKTKLLEGKKLSYLKIINSKK